jgi:hypothetical protein
MHCRHKPPAPPAQLAVAQAVGLGLGATQVLPELHHSCVGNPLTVTFWVVQSTLHAPQWWSSPFDAQLRQVLEFELQYRPVPQLLPHPLAPHGEPETHAVQVTVPLLQKLPPPQLVAQ